MNYLDKLAQMRVSGNGSGHPADDDAKKLYPFLWEMLTSKICLDDKAKIPAKITVQMGMGEWAISLTDESLAVSISTNAPTLAESFEALENALASGTGWVEWRKREPKLRKLSKKDGEKA